MARFRKKPVVIEAVQWRGTNTDELEDFAGERVWWGADAAGLVEPRVLTPEGLMRASRGDWIIKGVKGEFYPCKPDIFAVTYEPEPPASGEGAGK